MIKEIDDDNDGEISLREFFMIFRKAAAGELQAEGLSAIVSSIDVSEVMNSCFSLACYRSLPSCWCMLLSQCYREVTPTDFFFQAGVSGAKNFFESHANRQANSNK